MIDQHDLQLLRMLGLHEEPESAKKYRKLVQDYYRSLSTKAAEHK